MNSMLKIPSRKDAKIYWSHNVSEIWSHTQADIFQPSDDLPGPTRMAQAVPVGRST
jgi:hypothetical protein